MEDKKIFDLESIACEDCERYWDSSCDGHKAESPCKSFKAALKYDIPKRLVNLEKTVKNLSTYSLLSSIWCLMITIYMLLDAFKEFLE